MISHRHRCIFVHIPRTGGTSIENVIWPGERTEAELWMGFTGPYENRYQTGGLQHLLARQIREVVGPEIFASYFKFAFVRDPWDRALSQYAYMGRRPDLRAYIGMREGDSFEGYLELIQRKPHVQWFAQHEFILDEGGNQLVDFVGRFERLEDDARSIFARLGMRARLRRANASVLDGSPLHYDTESSRATVAALYARDFALYGFQNR